MDQLDDEPPCKKPCLNFDLITEKERYIDVGIEEFLNNEGEGFFGKIKERWEDFMVNEVDLNGKTIYLTSLELPASNKPVIDIENKFIDETIINELDNLVSVCGKNEIQFPAPEDKKSRTEIYTFIKSKYPTLYGNTEMRNDKLTFVITNYADERSQIAKKISKMSGEAEYCQFVLYKEGTDTIKAIDLISKYLRIKPNSFTYAGTKDRRGITTQLVRVRSCAANRLKGLNKCLKGIAVGNFEYVHTHLKLGDLYGNRFRLVIRDVDGTDEAISEAINRFKKGFINYYGMQRFGSTSIRSYEIGKLAIASKWEEMIKLILEPTDQDLPFMRDCKKKFKENGNCDEFLSSCGYSIEKSIVSGVAKHGYTLNAIDNLPRNVRQLYVHSYQSYVWNKMVSKRIRQFGSTTVLAGDLIECISDKTHQQAMPIDESQLDKCTISDIVLPLPGFNVQLPDNEVAQWYKDLLALDNLSMDKMHHRVKDFSLPGDYRKLIVVPADLQYAIHNYQDATIPLIGTDVQRMNNNFNLPLSEGPLKAVIIEFTLPKSAYATIAVRELMKTVRIIQ